MKVDMPLKTVVFRGRFTVRKLNPGHFSCFTVQYKCLLPRKSASWNVYSKCISPTVMLEFTMNTRRLCCPGSFYRLRALHTSLASLVSLVIIRDCEFFKHDVGAAIFVFACQTHTSPFFWGKSISLVLLQGWLWH